MRQERKDSLKRGEKFEDGLLRVDGCMQRYSVSRDSQYRTWQEDLPSRSFGMSALRQERRLMRDVSRLISAGFVPLASETLEQFVERNRDFLGKEVV